MGNLKSKEEYETTVTEPFITAVELTKKLHSLSHLSQLQDWSINYVRLSTMCGSNTTNGCPLKQLVLILP